MDRDHQVMAAIVVAVMFGVNGVALDRFVLWRRWTALYWLISALIVLVVAYLNGTGASENIAQSLWPREFDPIQRKEFGLRAACETPRMLGLWLIFMPLLLSVLLYKIYRFGLAGALQSHRLRDAIVLGVCFVLLYGSPLPESVAPVAFAEPMLQAPSHCTSIRPRSGSRSSDLALACHARADDWLRKRPLPVVNLALGAATITVRQRADAWGVIGSPKSDSGY